jgi:uncharacterized protein YggE
MELRRFLMFIVLGSFFMVGIVRAAEPRSISVSGEAEVKVAPDEVVLSLGVETRHKEIQAVRQAHELRVKKTIAALREAGIAGKDIKTDYLNLEPETESGERGRRVLVGYVQRTTLVALIRDITLFEKTLTGVLHAGVEHVHGVDFRTTELRKHRDQARAMAIKAAKEKAIALAGELGQKIGKPRSINEGGGGHWSSYNRWWGQSGGGWMTQNSIQSAPSSRGSSDSDTGLAPGMIGVQASVTVVFDLE